MTPDRNSDALARLRAAAPATGDVDLSALRAAVDERRAEGEASSVVDSGGGAGAETFAPPPDELDARRRRGMTGSGWAAAAAAAVIFGGGGILLGSGPLSDGGPDAPTADHAAEESDTAESDTVESDEAEPEADLFAEDDGADADGSDDAASDDEAPTPMREEGELASEVRFLAAELPPGPGTAMAWELEIEVGDDSAALVELGEVDVISPDDAVEMLNDPNTFANVDPVPPGPPGTVAPEGTLTIVAAELTWQTYENATGALALVPAYELTDSENQAWRVLAVADVSEID